MEGLVKHTCSDSGRHLNPPQLSAYISDVLTPNGHQCSE